MVPTTHSQQPSMASSAAHVHHHDLASCPAHHPAQSRHTVLMHTSSASGPQPTQSYEASTFAGVSVLQQFGLGGVSDYPKLVSALTLVSCSTLRPPATALLGLALLEEATQLPYDLISLE
ncbi:hypothetical protein HXX76_014928 [Chlamydomonas incerta]|uniref:Uncharacterized protein n=1 Tax=Chlamydomonas incerta TaxID=51695 RepID=A0A835SK80_CHLIN|nr:hypothetical protein HXX76_014928 [Chlamydomonas incerta]|eukprot:KAG2423874.1 hypothetical protein HXX76_014928 [Chlamydomonas incerta]